MAERSNAAVLKTVEPQGSGGSNPSLSATYPVIKPLAGCLPSRLGRGPVLAQDWKKELAPPLVTISETKVVIQQLELGSVTAQQGATSSSFQVKTGSEAPKKNS